MIISLKGLSNFISHLSTCHFLNSELTIELDHLLDDLVLRAIQMSVILELPGIVSALLCNPCFLSSLQVSLEVSVILADNPLGRIVEAVSDVVCSLGDVFKSIDIITSERLSIWSKAFHLFGIKTPILNSAVLPLFVLELKVVIEEILS